jgi:hypothetical protein
LGKKAPDYPLNALKYQHKYLIRPVAVEVIEPGKAPLAQRGIFWSLWNGQDSFLGINASPSATHLLGC